MRKSEDMEKKLKPLAEEESLRNNAHVGIGAIGSATEDMAEKCVQIDNAIDRIDGVHRHTINLYERIIGQCSPCKNDVEKPLPTLARVLAEAPDEIHGKCDAITEVLRDIENQLF